jgi:type IV pilus assembly protein PilP
MRRAILVSLALLAGGTASVLAQAAAAPAPEPTKPAAVIAPVPESPGQSMIEGEESALAGRNYSYDPAGRRDPFRSLLARQAKEELGQRPPGLRGMGVEEIKLQGILKLPEGYVAMIQGTDNTSYLIRPGTVLYDGNVESIEPGKVVFRMQVADPKSLKPFREVTRTLQ